MSVVTGSRLRVSVVRGGGLPVPLLDAWARIQRSVPGLHSPFFRPEYVESVAAVRPGIEAAVLEHGDEPVGFFPFERGARGLAGPVGGMLCDFDGLVSSPGLTLDARDLVRLCRLRGYRFRHVPEFQEPWHPYATRRNSFVFVDLSDGWEAYERSRRSEGIGQLRKAGQKSHKAAREVGPPRYEPEVRDPGVLRTLIGWKRAQYRRMRVADALAPEWTRRLLERLLGYRDPAFRGELATLSFGGRLAAVHFGVRSHEVMHSWFPAYDPELAPYSPGLLLFVALIRDAPARGIARIDLGLAFERFKLSIGTDVFPVAEGMVDLRLVAGPLARDARRLADWVRLSPLRKPARAINHLAARLFASSRNQP